MKLQNQWKSNFKCVPVSSYLILNSLQNFIDKNKQQQNNVCTFLALATLSHFKSVFIINTPCSTVEDTIFTTSDVTLNSQHMFTQPANNRIRKCSYKTKFRHTQQVPSWRSCTINTPVLFLYYLITLWAAIWNRPAVTTTKVWKL